MLTENQIQAIDYLLSGTLTKADIAKRVGISTRTLYRWEKDEEFKAELDKCRNHLKNKATNRIVNETNSLVDVMLDLAYKSSDQRVKYNATKYLLDRSLGVPTAAKEDNVDPGDDKNKDTNTLKKELEDIKNLTVVK